MEEHPTMLTCSSSATSLNFSPNPPCCSSSSNCGWQFQCASSSSSPFSADQADKWRLITSSSADDSSSGGVQEGKRPPIRTKTTMMTMAAMAGCAMPSACCSPQQQQKVRLKKCVEKSRSRRRKVDDDELSCARLLVRPFLVRTLLGSRSGIGKGTVGGNWARKGKGINKSSRREERCCCYSCGDCDRRGGGAAESAAAEAAANSSVYGNWQSLSQIVHLRARRATNRGSGSSSSFLSRESSMEEHDDDGEGKAGCRESFCGRKMKEWLFWFIVAFLAGLTIKDVVSLFKEYSANPKKSDMNVRFNETMAMPNITFCMSRAQAWSHFRLNGTDSKEWEKAIAKQLKNMTDKESFLKQPWEFGLVMETYNLISTLTSMERETTAHGMVSAVDKFRTQDRLAEIRKLTKFWLNELQKRGVTFEEFMQKVGKETLRRSMQRFHRTSYDEDLVIKTQLTITWLSQMQLCFQPTFDQENFKPIDDQGQFFVMALSHNSETLDGQQVDCMSADFHGRPSSSSRFMGNKGTTKDGFTDELCIGMMHETTVELKARYKMLPNDEEGTACRDEDDGGDNEWDCHLRCRLDFIRSICNCSGPTLSHLAKSEEELGKWPLCDYAKCKVDVQTGNYSDEECAKKCYRSCDQIRYNIDHERKGKSARPDFTTVVLKWGSFEYLTLEQDWVWSATTFVAAIGGSIGMWLGLSILSLIQGSTYLADYVTNNVIKKKRKQRQLSITDEPTQLPKASKASKIHPKLSKAFHDDQQHEDKLTANPFVSPFKKLSQVSPPPAGE